VNYRQHVVNAFRSGMLAVAVLTAVGAIVLFAAPLAGAALIHKPLFQLAREIPAVGPHGETVALPGPVRRMESVTVDSGHVWVAEDEGVTHPSRIDEFDAASGAFVAQPVHVVAPASGYGYGYGEGIAVGHGTGEAAVYAGGQVNSVSVVSVFNEAGALRGTWNGEATPSGSFGTIFEEPGRVAGTVTGVAVDNSESVLDPSRNDVAVADPTQDTVYVFRAEADGKEHYLGQITGTSPSEPFQDPTGVAVDEANGDLLVLDQLKDQVDVFEPSVVGNYVFAYKISGPSSNRPFSEVHGLAVDSGTGDFYVLEGTRVDQFSIAGAYLGQIENTPHVYSLAVDPTTHDVYAGHQVYGPEVVIPDVATNPPANVKPESVLLSGTVDPDGAGNATCQFEWGTSPSFGKTAPCPTEIANGTSAVPVEVTLTGLERGVTYYYRLRASNTEGTNPGEGWQNQSFTTPGALLHGESIEDVSDGAATLEATIDPNQTPTSYYFQYGLSAAYGQQYPVPPGESVGAGKSDVEVPGLRLQGLSPATVYHYRVVVVNEIKPGELETIYGEDHAFTTQAASAPFTLPDGRSWELVSPASKLGALIMPSYEGGSVQASVNGDAIAYLTSSPTEAEPQGYPVLETVLSTRGTTGWSSQDISSPHDQEAGVQEGSGEEFRLFSPDLSLAAVTPVSIGFTPLSQEASESTTYLRSDYQEGNVGARCKSSCYRPLVTKANTPPGTVFGEEPHGECVWRACGPRSVGASVNLQHIILASPAQLTSTPAPVGGASGLAQEEGLYEWSAGRLQLVGVPPEGEEGQVVLAGSLSYQIGHDAAGVRNAVSEDGERVILEGGISEVGGGPAVGTALYLREVGAGETIRLDESQGGTGPSEGLSYMTASSDASRIFFLDSGHLTGRSSASGEDLYEYDLNAPPGARLSDLTADANLGEAAEVKAVIGASKDGAYVYFLAEGVLAEGAHAGGLNLYVSHAGTTKLITTLANEDSILYEDHLLARVSPNGGWLAFMSSADLTGYDTHDAISGQPDEEVYLYDAGTGRLVCASCDPSGARPVGLQMGGEAGERASNGDLENLWVAANVVSSRDLSSNSRKGGLQFASSYQPDYLSDSGRVFFDSSDALVPEDVNGTEDVYEYEPAGVGRCSSSSATFASASQGCIDLVSSGASPVESAFVDASETGGDAFFMTQARLTTQDYDSAYDMYDAHECTSAAPCFSTPAQPPECETEASCRAAPTPQPALYGAPSSATFSGAGNVSPPVVPAGKPKVKVKVKPKPKCGKHKAKGSCAKKAKPSRRKRTTAAKSRRGGHR
jgi:hypothetical protein